ncbi:Werner syndrome ATP-dependent helicase homolog [Haliotis rufescens]|uniref:Werner syndrome ATP-dependent helicase homolog n=1 Tax=Haliotis rufescens TaxID=6454 RepID=UPI00201F24E3|nr:Werner syndrome ATP-dependent helicase homolog [Haliotis rufescens]
MNKRIRARKRGLPDWMVDDDEPESQASNALNSTEDQVEDEQPKVNRIKRPFCKPSYEYLPGNKHGQKSKGNTLATPEAGTSLSADDVVAQAMPFIAFAGSTVYTHNFGDCSLLCEEIIRTCLDADNNSELCVGFDLEWPVTYMRGNGGRVALVQVAVNEYTCYLFHISAIGSLPKMLKRLIEDDRVKKIGVNIENDMWKLAKDFDFEARKVIRNSMIDLGKLANTKLKSKENWSLDGLCRNVLRMRMNKDESVRCGKWDDFPLTDEQKLYAATDAYACLKIYNTLEHAQGS